MPERIPAIISLFVV